LSDGLDKSKISIGAIMSDNNPGKKWWTKPVWKLPLWAWIVIVIVIISAIGTSGSSQNETSSVGNNSETTEQNQSDTTIQETENTTAPSKPEMSVSQENAVEEARSYLRSMAFSRQGLIDQLSSEYGSKFPLADAEFAVAYIENNSEVDWNAQAVKSAKEYLDSSSFSCNGLIDQLSSEYGSKFTESQATYGATQAGLC
jgi:hypothetical protein